MITEAPENKWIKYISQALIILLGMTFIFSGLIKLNDPVGTKIKLEEYFEVFAQDLPTLEKFFEFLIPLSLSFSLILCVAEVVLGVSILIKYEIKRTLWFLLVLTVFFTFLTFYSAFFNKVTDCGCFGDAIKLKPWSSFTKDIILLSIILILISQQKNIRDIKNFSLGTFIVIFSTLISLFLGLYAIFLLPPIDFLPYKVGANIPKGMELPPNAKPDVYQITYTLKNLKDSSERKINDSEYMQKEIWKDSLTWKIKNSVSNLISEGDKAKIMGFSVWDSQNNDFTTKLFEGDKFLIIIQSFKEATPNHLRKISQLINNNNSKGIFFIVLTASDGKTAESFMQELKLNIPFYFADATVLKTMIRTNPGFILLHNGNIVKKWSTITIPNPEEIKEYLQIK